MESGGMDILYRGDTVLTREVLAEYPHPVVSKRPTARHPSARVLDALETEYASALTLQDVDGVRRVLGRQSIAGQPALILEYIGGESLREHVASNKPDLRAKLEIAVQLARILEGMHGRECAHLALSGDNILIDKTDHGVHVIDLGAAVRVTKAGGHMVQPDQPLGNLSYISPEQTGRVNRAGQPGGGRALGPVLAGGGAVRTDERAPSLPDE
jgi:serine/threonine protein kinase